MCMIRVLCILRDIPEYVREYVPDYSGKVSLNCVRRGANV